MFTFQILSHADSVATVRFTYDDGTIHEERLSTTPFNAVVGKSTYIVEPASSEEAMKNFLKQYGADWKASVDRAAAESQAVDFTGLTGSSDATP
jgi:hypothetical protein